MFRQREKGASRLKTVFGLLVLAAIIYCGIQIVPPFVNNYQLQDAMKEEARFAGVNRRDPESIKDAIFVKMRELNIPARREDIHVELNGPFSYLISLDYSVTVDLRVYQLRLQFHPQGDSGSL
jgi:hypothetical protein